jgi:hypothetical protein
MSLPLTPDQIAEITAVFVPAAWEMFWLGAVIISLLVWVFFPTRHQVDGWLFPDSYDPSMLWNGRRVRKFQRRVWRKRLSRCCFWM